VYEKPVNTTVAVLKGMYEDKAVGDGGGMDNGGGGDVTNKRKICAMFSRIRVRVWLGRNWGYGTTSPTLFLLKKKFIL